MPTGLDHLAPQMAQDAGLHHHHAFVAEPDAPIPERELQRARQIGQGGRRAFFQQAAVAASGDSRGPARRFGQRDAFGHFHYFMKDLADFRKFMKFL
jgi:hypothetical protein